MKTGEEKLVLECAIICGLGNPGAQFEHTRHNMGFLVIDYLAGYFRLTWNPWRGDYYMAEGKWQEHEFLLIKPLTYMNRSGIALRQVMENSGGELGELLVICDDVSLPLGRIRFRRSGSDGGNKGLASIIYYLQSEDFNRLRIGVADETLDVDIADFVLTPLPDNEKEKINSIITSAVDGILCWMKFGIDKAMNDFNSMVIK